MTCSASVMLIWWDWNLYSKNAKRCRLASFLKNTLSKKRRFQKNIQAKVYKDILSTNFPFFQGNIIFLGVIFECLTGHNPLLWKKDHVSGMKIKYNRSTVVIVCISNLEKDVCFLLCLAIKCNNHWKHQPLIMSIGSQGPQLMLVAHSFLLNLF